MRGTVRGRRVALVLQPAEYRKFGTRRVFYSDRGLVCLRGAVDHHHLASGPRTAGIPGASKRAHPGRTIAFAQHRHRRAAGGALRRDRVFPAMGWPASVRLTARAANCCTWQGYCWTATEMATACGPGRIPTTAIHACARISTAAAQALPAPSDERDNALAPTAAILHNPAAPGIPRLAGRQYHSAQLGHTGKRDPRGESGHSPALRGQPARIRSAHDAQRHQRNRRTSVRYRGDFAAVATGPAWLPHNLRGTGRRSGLLSHGTRRASGRRLPGLSTAGRSGSQLGRRGAGRHIFTAGKVEDACFQYQSHRAGSAIRIRALPGAGVEFPVDSLSGRRGGPQASGTAARDRT